MRALAALVVLAGLALGVPSAEAIDVGQPAPDFTLNATTGGKVSLSQFRGKQPVLIEFYGGDFAPVCSDNLSTRKADYAKFQELGIQILGISANNSFSQKAFADSLKLPYPLLSDLTLDATKRYGVLYGSTSGKLDYPQLVGRMAKRAFFLVDRNGIVRARWIGEDLAVFPSVELLKVARELAAKR